MKTPMFNSNIILDGEGLTFKKHFETSKEMPIINFTMAKDNFIALIKRNDYTCLTLSSCDEETEKNKTQELTKSSISNYESNHTSNNSSFISTSSYTDVYPEKENQRMMIEMNKVLKYTIKKKEQIKFNIAYTYDIDNIKSTSVYIERLCFLSIPRIVSINSSYYLIQISPMNAHNSKYILIIKNIVTSQIIESFALNDIVSCCCINMNSFLIQIYNKCIYKSLNIVTKTAEECANYVRGINLLVNHQRFSI